MTRAADELINTPDPAWPVLQQMLAGARPTVRVLGAAEADGRREIELLQVSARSLLGAAALYTGGLLIDSGWLRVLGCGHTECAWSITAATKHVGFGLKAGPPEGLVVAIDVLGGLFAINGGFLADAEAGYVTYFAPDTLQWESLGIGHSAWLESTLRVQQRSAFYADLRWSGWEQEVAALPPNMGLSVYPPLWSRESRPIEATRRAVVPIAELVTGVLDMARQVRR